MSQIILSAKSGSDWTDNELHALNITISPLSPTSFFGTQLPAATVDPILLNNLKRISRTPPAKFPSGPPTESAVDDFAAFLLGLLDYDEPERVVHQRLEIGFMMCGKKVEAKPDVVIMDGGDYLLLVQQDKGHLSLDDAEPQFIAAAIAAYYANNRQRTAAGLPPLTSEVFVGIVMYGTAPTFYKIPITSEPVTAIARAQFPQNATILYLREGMVPLENRGVVFQCLAAFKQVVRGLRVHLQSMLEFGPGLYMYALGLALFQLGVQQGCVRTRAEVVPAERATAAATPQLLWAAAGQRHVETVIAEIRLHFLQLAVHNAAGDHRSWEESPDVAVMEGTNWAYLSPLPEGMELPKWVTERTQEKMCCSVDMPQVEISLDEIETPALEDVEQPSLEETEEASSEKTEQIPLEETEQVSVEESSL
ncbi:hypothetical protein C8R43DRAFT_1113028 [Mycena crocata]|nr:hypothetical protein C8R43DRAFT_1113028 [Mycena crocata]